MSLNFLKISVDWKVENLWKKFYIKIIPDNLLLTRYLKTYNFRVEKALKLIKFSFGLRAKNQHIFTKRDFRSPEIESILKTW